MITPYLDEYLKICETKKQIVSGSKWKHLSESIFTVLKIEYDQVHCQRSFGTYHSNDVIPLKVWIAAIRNNSLTLIS